MTVITHARRKSRLSRLIDEAGGMSVGVALAQARANLDTLRPQSLAEIAAQASELAAVAKPADEAEVQAELKKVYFLANAVIDAAGPFQMTDICDVAAVLCDLIDATAPEKPFDWRVVPVCSSAIQLLLTLPDDAVEERAKIHQGLDLLISRKLGATPVEV
ncbi:hypothetical protein GCM10009422_19030 [Brevundimonas kwangchunensis]|uniref:Chemotaxis protein CheE n=1 Tax=Brevundimonas kwangchunensis TaxID=322163 RepID=A0ABN1GYN2_9CAUL